MILKHRAPHRLSWFGRIAFVVAAMLVLPWTLSAISAEGEPAPPTADAAPAEGSSSAPTAATAPELPAPPTTPAPVTPPAPNSPTAVPPTGTPALPPEARNVPGAPPSALPPPISATPRPTSPLVDLPPGPTADAQPALTPVGPGVSTPAVNDAQVLQRLARLEATTAELLAIVRELRAQRQGDDRVGPPRYDTGGGRGVATAGRYGGHDDPSSIVLPIRREGRTITIQTSGRQIEAVDADTGRRLWATVAPANVTAIQSRGTDVNIGNGIDEHGNAIAIQSRGPDTLEAIAADGTMLLIDAATGKFKQSSRAASVPNGRKSEHAVQAPTATIRRGAAHATQDGSDDAASDASNAGALRSDRAAKIEMELLAPERKLAIERADLQHRVRQLETRRTRLTRKLDLFTSDAVQRDPKLAEEREKVISALEATEDELADMQHTLDIFDAELEFKLRELQIQRDQALRGVGGASNPPSRAPMAPASSRR